jgi:hypothetical protein
MCKLLLASGADVLERDFFGRGALHYANNVKVMLHIYLLWCAMRCYSYHNYMPDVGSGVEADICSMCSVCAHVL